MPCPSRKITQNIYFKRQDRQNRRQQQQQHQQNQELDETLARILCSIHIAPPPDHYLL